MQRIELQDSNDTQTITVSYNGMELQLILIPASPDMLNVDVRGTIDGNPVQAASFGMTPGTATPHVLANQHAVFIERKP